MITLQIVNAKEKLALRGVGYEFIRGDILGDATLLNTLLPARLWRDDNYGVMILLTHVKTTKISPARQLFSHNESW